MIHLENRLDLLSGNALWRLEDVCGVHEPREGIEFVVDLEMSCLEIRLNVRLVHWEHRRANLQHQKLIA